MNGFHDDARDQRHLDARDAQMLRAEQDARWAAPDTEAEWDALVERINAHQTPAPVDYFALAQSICLPPLTEASR
jgi:hypothetical protein